jgi:phenylacetate-CoA ligase
MKLYPLLVKKTLQPIKDFYSKKPVSKYLEIFEKTQYWNYDDLKRYQSRQLRKLIDHAYHNVPFYHRIMKKNNLYPNDIKISEDLKKLPVIYKDDIRKNPKDFLAKNWNEYKYVQGRTSGSTGEPFRYFIDYERWSMGKAMQLRNWQVAGYQLGEKKVTIGGSALIPNENKKLTVKDKLYYKMDSLIVRNLSLQGVHISNDILMNYVEKINYFKPVMIRGYPSVLECFCDFLLEKNISITPPKIVYTVAEKLYKFQREKIEKGFSCANIFEGYGGGDVAVNTLECEKHNRHICLETAVMELLDKNDEDVSINCTGRIVTTMLNNYTQVFIRYDTGDLGVVTDEVCDCGREYPLMKEIIGRSVDTLKFSNGISLGSPAITVILREFNIKQYQIIQEKRDELIIKIIKNKNYKASETKKIFEIMKYHCGNGVNIELDFVNNIPTTAAGKRRYIVSKVNMSS